MLYPPIEPFATEFLRVSPLHEIFIEQCGNPNGLPVVFLHGGPGGGIQESYRRYFDPERYYIILFDQRGCGKSTPFAEIRENTTWDLVSDMEIIRKHLKIEKWCLFGGSWGSTLALSYALTHPKNCLALFLRGIFTLRKKELDWFYQEGASKIFPDFWQDYLSPIPPHERGQLLEAYYQKLTSEDQHIQIRAAKAWSTWEAATSKLIPSKQQIEHYGEDQFALAFARIECHYFINKGFFESDNFLLSEARRIKHIPTIIVQGRYDIVCPTETAYELSLALENATLIIIDNAGHSLGEEGITEALLRATDQFASKGIMTE